MISAEMKITSHCPHSHHSQSPNVASLLLLLLLLCLILLFILLLLHFLLLLLLLPSHLWCPVFVMCMCYHMRKRETEKRRCGVEIIHSIWASFLSSLTYSSSLSSDTHSRTHIPYADGRRQEEEAEERMIILAVCVHHKRKRDNAE